MAKKRFTDSFDNLFDEPMEERQPEGKTVANNEAVAEEQSAPVDEEGKKASGKNFTDSLQSFLSETFEESFDRQLAESQKRKAAATPSSHRPKRRRSSLDMLIRSTVEPSKIEIDTSDRPKRRRITLTFEPQKLEKLRSIAKVERAILKDIINDIVGEYIRKYETEKGKNV